MIRRLAPLAPAALVALLVVASTASAATTDLRLTRFDPSLPVAQNPVLATGDSVEVVFDARNTSTTTTKALVVIETPASLRFLGLSPSNAAGFGLTPVTCSTAPDDAGTTTTCEITVPKRGHNYLGVRVGGAAPGTQLLRASIAPTGGNTDPTPTNAGATDTVKTVGKACTVTGLNSGDFGPSAAETVTGTEGNDVLCGFGGFDVCTRGTRTFTCRAYRADTINGLGGDDVALLPNANSTKFGGACDTIDLGAGTDQIVNVDRSGQNAEVVMGLVESTLQFSDGDSVHRCLHTVQNAERYLGGIGQDMIDGSPRADDIDGGPGDDFISGNDGDDRLEGGVGTDTVGGGPGTDTLTDAKGAFDIVDAEGTGSTFDFTAGTVVAQGSTDTFTGFEGADGTIGNDTFTGSTRAEVFAPIDGADVVRAGGGFDRLDLSTADAKVTADLATGKVSGGVKVTSTGLEMLIGTPFADVLWGSARVDRIEGGFGNDVIDGRGGADVLYGQEGRDTIHGGAGRDQIFGGPGVDTLMGGDERDRCQQDDRSGISDC